MLELVHQLLAASNKEMITVKNQPKQPTTTKSPNSNWHCLFSGGFAEAGLFLHLVSDTEHFWVRKTILGKMPKSGTELQIFPKS